MKRSAFDCEHGLTSQHHLRNKMRLSHPAINQDRDSLRCIRSAISLAEFDLVPRNLYQNGNSILDFQPFDLSVSYLLAIAHECQPRRMKRCLRLVLVWSRRIAARLRRVIALTHPDPVWLPVCTFDGIPQ